jgi:hypothetical protein
VRLNNSRPPLAESQIRERLNAGMIGLAGACSKIRSLDQRYRGTAFGRSFCLCGYYLVRRLARSDEG